MLHRPPPIWTPSRRQLIGGAAALSLAPRTAHALSSGDRKFVFVLASGGWDPTRVFADGSGHAVVDPEAGAEPVETSGVRWVRSDNRPSVTTWFERYASRAAIVNGILVPSIAHEQCIVLALTGTTGDQSSDWASILGNAAMERFAAPTLVLGGPSFPGVNLPAVIQAGGRGQLGDLITGGYAAWGTRAGASLGADAREVLAAHVRARGSEFSALAQAARSRSLADAFVLATEQQARLGALPEGFAFEAFNTLDGAVEVAANALSTGVSRVAMLSAPPSGELAWDSHTTNDDLQNVMYERLFASLLLLFDLLETLPGEQTATLIEETTVCVYSEMGRSPWLNAGMGKDHWPHTSMLLAGSGIRGGQTVGGYDSSWYGQPIDFATGEPDAGGESITCGAIGATLLALGDVDPGEWVPSSAPITALMDS